MNKRKDSIDQVVLLQHVASLAGGTVNDETLTVPAHACVEGLILIEEFTVGTYRTDKQARCF